MTRMIAIICLAGLGLTAKAVNYDAGEVFASVYRPYFDSLQLYYETPKGCSEQTDRYGKKYSPVCELAADFNSDGITDYAALIEYTGGNLRSGNRYLDLVILYSSMDGTTNHQIYTRVGRVSDRGVIDHYLEVQPVGEVMLPTGPDILEHPSINLVNMNAGSALVEFWSFDTFYWVREKFVRLNKDSD